MTDNPPHGEQRLCGADVRGAVRRDLAVAPVLRSNPGDGVLPVLTLMDERLELAFGGEPTARVLEDNGEACVQGPNDSQLGHELRAGRVRLVVRRPLKQGRKRSVPV